MIGEPVTVGALLMAVTAVVWAGLFCLAEEAPGVPEAAGWTPGASDTDMPLQRALQVSRLGLLVIGAASGTVIVEWWARPTGAALAAVAVSVALVYLVADALPRGLGVLAPQLARAAVPFARRSLWPFRPLLGIIAAVDRGLALIVPPSGQSNEKPRREERDILARVLSLGSMTVEEVMTPRLDVFAIDAASGWGEVVELVRRSEHARIPVYRDDLDNIVGVLHAKDLTPAVSGLAPPPAEWHKLVRSAQYVPESKALVSQLRAFQSGRSHLAIVVDEFGGTSGLVTLEDVLEEVVGEIYGEYDADEEPEIESEGEDRFWVDGAVSLDQLSSVLGTEIEREDVSTVGGLIYSELGRVPRPGEQLKLGEFRVVVERMVRRRVRRVYFERQSGASTVEAGAEGTE